MKKDNTFESLLKEGHSKVISKILAASQTDPSIFQDFIDYLCRKSHLWNDVDYLRMRKSINIDFIPTFLPIIERLKEFWWKETIEKRATEFVEKNLSHLNFIKENEDKNND